MWCTTSSSTCSAGARRRTPARSTGSRSRSKGRATSASAKRRASMRRRGGGAGRKRDGGGERRDRRQLEHLAERHLGACGGAQPAHHLGGEQRVPAQREEIGVAGHPRQVQDLAPDPRDQLLGGGARR